MNITRFFTLNLFATFSWVAGCETTTRDPLAGWKLIYSHQLNKMVADDYQNYIEKLPTKEKYYIQGIIFDFLKIKPASKQLGFLYP